MIAHENFQLVEKSRSILSVQITIRTKVKATVRLCTE